MIRFTQPAAFNDPFEMNPYLEAIATDEYIERRMAKQHEADVLKAYNEHPFSFKWRIPFRKYFARFDKETMLKKLKEAATGPALTHARESLPIAINDAVGILCLTETADNLLMWAHYAASHSGLVLEFNCDNEFFVRHFPNGTMLNPTGFDADLRKDYGFLRRVEYSPLRPALTVGEVTSFDRFLVKSIEWGYEREWRMLMPFPYADKKIESADGQPIYLFAIPLAAISKVILGERTSGAIENEVKAIVSSNPETTHIRIERMTLNPKEFKLSPVPVTI
jgi:hypothetical protein